MRREISCSFLLLLNKYSKNIDSGFMSCLIQLKDYKSNFTKNS